MILFCMIKILKKFRWNFEKKNVCSGQFFNARPLQENDGPPLKRHILYLYCQCALSLPVRRFWNLSFCLCQLRNVCRNIFCSAKQNLKFLIAVTHSKNNYSGEKRILQKTMNWQCNRNFCTSFHEFKFSAPYEMSHGGRGGKVIRYIYLTGFIRIRLWKFSP